MGLIAFLFAVFLVFVGKAVGAPTWFFVILPVIVALFGGWATLRETASFGMENAYIPPARYFECTEHGTRILAGLYDHDDPPTCPVCGKILVK